MLGALFFVYRAVNALYYYYRQGWLRLKLQGWVGSELVFERITVGYG